MTYSATSRYNGYAAINHQNAQHRPRIDATIASATCLAMVYQGNAVMRSMRDLNPKLDKWKIKAAIEKLADLEETYTKFLPFAPDQSGSFLSRFSTR